MDNQEMIVLEVFNAMADEILMYEADEVEMFQLCNALSLDLQLARENNYNRVIYDA